MRLWLRVLTAKVQSILRTLTRKLLGQEDKAAENPLMPNPKGDMKAEVRPKTVERDLSTTDSS